MGKKTKPRAPQVPKAPPPVLRTWLVISDGQEIEVEAVDLYCGGALVFSLSKDGHVIRAFAPGHWSTVALKPNAP